MSASPQNATAEDVEREASGYILHNLGDRVFAGDPAFEQRSQQWTVPIRAAALSPGADLGKLTLDVQARVIHAPSRQELQRQIKRRSAATHWLLANIREDLRVGHTQLTLLGNKRDSQTLFLDSPVAMTRYADMMKANLARAMNGNRKRQWIAVLCLVLLFAISTYLTVLAQLWHLGWPATLTTVSGLGVTAYWPIRMILRVRTENLLLALLPDLLPLLSRNDLSNILDRLLTGQK